MLLTHILPSLPSTLTETLVYIVGMLGTILLAYSVFVEREFRSDVIRFVGSACLIVYTLFIGNIFLTTTFAALGLASLVEAIEIHLGLLKNPEVRH